MADANYFRFVNVGWAILISTGLAVLAWSYHDPEGIPWIFGPLGQLGTFLGKTYPKVIKNIDKGLSSSATGKWFLQTFVFGFASFLQLNKAKKVKLT
ncbi:uncharacterized protein LOC111136874 isoform X2 [Crassostrea virginica]|uniref:Transmembrane protein 254 n=1 Tax=Crassostrea virginica TaxID=6565 RepID=A0A8B8EUT4_CRAVI|nr:transmembrane protein 254-like isoform X2 [Crassostrea virginica]